MSEHFILLEGKAISDELTTTVIHYYYPLLAYFSTMKLSLYFLCLFLSVSCFAQPYWQQRVDTRIEVKLDDNQHILNGFEEIEYTNNAPDTLQYIYMHLWPNAYKNDLTPFAKQQDINHSTAFYFAKRKDRGYMDSLQFFIDGARAEHFSTEATPDIARVDLPKPLLPGGKIKITTPFRVKLPIIFSRNGHTGQAYYVSQFFPKPAVYDSKGWHPISYLDQGEFYSEFGSYDVAVTLPANYVILATGNCMNERENKWLDSLSTLPLPADTLYSKKSSKAPVSSTEWKTVRFTEDNIHDFAWFADKRFIVRKDTVTSPGNKKLVTTWTAFLPEYQAQWKNGTQYLKDAILHYGQYVGPYPYSTIKAVLGDMKSGGGMEYPTITLIDRVATAKLETVIIHEAGHNWFYGMLASNERDHAWMDEGLNTFYEQKTTASIHKIPLKKKKNKVDEALLYYELAATNDDQPINSHSEHFRNLNYGIDVYYKTALMLGWLEEYMGADTFGLAMRSYFEQWRFRHPQPEDFRAVMEQYTSKPLNWFFEDLLNTSRKIDFAVIKAKIREGNTVVTIKNNSAIAAPVHIAAYRKDSMTGDAWTTPFAGTTSITMAGTNWNKIKVESDIPDAKTANDAYRKNALFHHFGIKLKPFAGINRSEKDKVFIGPALGLNKYDGFMGGLFIHNLTIPENRFVFAFAPMYSFRTETFTSAGAMGFSWYPNSKFKEIMIKVDAKSFHHNETSLNMNRAIYARYTKIAPSILFTLKESNPLSPVIRTLSLKQYNITEDAFAFGTDSLAIPTMTNSQNMYAGLRYQHLNKRTYNPFSYSLDGHGNADFAKLNVEGNIRIDYYAPKKSLFVRAYFGKFFAINNNPATTNRYILNASYSGMNDYLYDGTYRGRNVQDGLVGQQVSAIQEGGFKIPVFNGVLRSDNWLAAVNLKTDLPKIGFPIRIFVDAGIMPNPNPGFKNVKSTTVFYDAGLELFLSKEVSVFFPLLMSQEIRDHLSSEFGSKNVFTRSISFTLNLENINWLRLPGKLIKTTLN